MATYGPGAIIDYHRMMSSAQTAKALSQLAQIQNQGLSGWWAGSDYGVEFQSATPRTTYRREFIDELRSEIQEWHGDWTI